MRTYLFLILSTIGLIGNYLFPIETPGLYLAFDPFTLIFGGASILSGLLGNSAEMSAEERAAALREKGVKEFLNIHIPDAASQRLALEEFVQTGKLTPELETVYKAANTEMDKVKRDPRLKESRMRALSSLEDLGYGGESTADAAAQQKALIESGARSRGQQDAILSSMERRGQLGSGLELTARMDAAQAEGDRLATQGLDLEKERRDRALKAVMGAGDLAGKIESDEFKMDADVAKARDAMSLFNIQNMQAVGNRNTDRTNAGNQYNLDREQSIADKNVGTRNFEQQYNKELAQKRFDNQVTRANGISGQYANQAAGESAAGKSAADMWGSVASGIGQVGASITGKKAKEAPAVNFSTQDDEDEDFFGRVA